MRICACGEVLSVHPPSRSRLFGLSEGETIEKKNLMQMLDKIDCEVEQSGNNNEENFS